MFSYLCSSQEELRVLFWEPPFYMTLMSLARDTMCLCVDYSVHVCVLYVYIANFVLVSVCLHVLVLNGSLPASLSR